MAACIYTQLRRAVEEFKVTTQCGTLKSPTITTSQNRHVQVWGMFGRGEEEEDLFFFTKEATDF